MAAAKKAPTPVTPPKQSPVGFLQKYESEISTLLGVIVVIVLASILFVFIRRSSPATTPQISDLGETTNEDLMNQGGKKYAVKAGDGLWNIAQTELGDGYKWTEIAKANNLKSPYTLTEGQELTLPDVTAASPSPAATTIASSTPQATVVPSATPHVSPTASVRPTSTPAPATTPTISGSSYTVATNDSLWKIAVARYGDGYKWVEIYKANKEKIGSNPGIIIPGQQLNLPDTK